MRATWAVFVNVALSLLAVPLIAQSMMPWQNSTNMSDRERRGLRGPVKSCSEESTYPTRADSGGKSYPGNRSEYTVEYDLGGRILSTHALNPDGSSWISRFDYEGTGGPENTAEKSPAITNYSYDQQGKLQSVNSGDKSVIPTFGHDEHGRKIATVTSRPEDYRANVATGGSPFEGLTWPPNLPGGGTSTTIFDDQDRPVEVEVRDAHGEIVNRAVRTYNSQGQIAEEKQIMENPETMFPPEVRAKIAEESGLSDSEVRQQLRAKLQDLMGGQSVRYSVSYTYDNRGQLTHTSRRIFNQHEEIDASYDEQGDLASEITRTTTEETGQGTAKAPTSAYSEVRYAYQYDQHGNWTQKETVYRSAPDAAFQPPSVVKRRLEYY